MNLIYVHTGKFPSNSPSMTFVLYNAIALSSKCSKFYLFVKNNSEEETNEIFIKNYNINLPVNLSLQRIKSLLRFKANILFFVKVYFNIIKILKTEKIDAVITRSTKFLPWLIKLKKNKVKVFYETHDFYADIKMAGKKSSRMNKRLEKYERKYIPQLDGVLCLQKAQINVYKKVLNNFNKFYLARTGIDNIYDSEFINRKYLTYIGSFDSHKGIIELLKAFSCIPVKNKLLLIGGKTKKEISIIEKIVLSLNLSERVIVTGWLHKEKIYELLKETLIGVVPLQPTFFNNYLTSPLKIFDYFSCGIPVLAADLPTTRELIVENKTGFFFKAGSEKDLAEKLKLMLSDNEMLKRISDNIYEYSKTLLWDERAKLIMDIIDGNENA
jgi:glycosyltransferase involved in cell wall biosynthesis